MRKILILLFSIFSFATYSQTIDETINWINENSTSKNRVYYLPKTNKIQLVKIDIIPGVIKSVWVQEFYPKDVRYVSSKEGKDGWNSLFFKFKKGGSNVTFFTNIGNSKIRKDEITKNGEEVDIYIESNKETINKFKKAYLNLFNKLGAEAKDGDFF